MKMKRGTERRAVDSLETPLVQPACSPPAREAGTQLSPDDIAAIRRFFELLDEWDRKDEKSSK
jgi:hypothetical protein